MARPRGPVCQDKEPDHVVLYARTRTLGFVLRVTGRPEKVWSGGLT